MRAAGNGAGARWARAVVAGVLVLLFVLRSAAPGLHSVAFDLGGDATLAGIDCGAEAQDGPGAPRKDDGQTPCCLLCVERFADAVIPKPVAPVHSDAYAPRAEGAFVPAASARPEPIESAVGWASSWSSQAPPAFS